MDAMERTFVFADLAGYTALTEAHGDTDAAEIAMAFHALAAKCMGADGHVVKTIGDAVMIVCETVEGGIVCASKIAAAVVYFCSKSCAVRFAESPDAYLIGLSARV